MNVNKKLVYFGAHPDDESFGIGSTLAQYSSAGVRTFYVCSTGGELGTVEDKYLKGYDSIKELRYHEMECAGKVLGLERIFHLGFRDSGMQGSESNKHPKSLAMADIDEVTKRMVKIIREIQPDVVVTHDDSGSYGHPDHIATSKGAEKAFFAAGDSEQYPEAGEAFQPKKLYFSIRPRRYMKTIIRLMPLFGQDPHHFGRNRDVDLTKMTGNDYPVHAVIKHSKKAVETRSQAMACHESQTSGVQRVWPFKVMELLGSLRGSKDYFVRLYPTPDNKRKEKDLFHGI